MLAPAAKGQFYSLPADHSFNFLTQRKLAARDSQVTQGLQPYLPLTASSQSFVADTHVVFKYIKEDPALDFIFKRHFVTVRPKGDKFTLVVDPLLNVETGDELQKPGSYRLYTNTRGF